MNERQHNSVDLPAILGGAAECAQGPPDWPPNDPEIAEAVGRAIADGTWSQYHGPHCEELTARWAEYHDSEHVMLCSSGTVAVELALRGLKIGPGDEVILAAYDFKGNFTNVLTLGARPVLVDVDEHNWNVNVGSLDAAIGPATRAILVSHLHGGIVPMPDVMSLAERHGLPVIEDACQMPGAIIHGRKAGLWGDVGVYSFGGSKLLSAGRGGALVTNIVGIAQRARLYSQRGNEAYPLSELQAAVIVPQMLTLDARNRLRAENVARLCNGLESVPGLKPFANPVSDSEPGYYKLGLQYEPTEFAGLSREQFLQAVQAEGVALHAGFRSLNAIHGSRRYRAVDDLTVANRADQGVVTLHHPVLLEEEQQINTVIKAITKVQQHAREIRDQLESGG